MTHISPAAEPLKRQYQSHKLLLQNKVAHDLTQWHNPGNVKMKIRLTAGKDVKNEKYAGFYSRSGKHFPGNKAQYFRKVFPEMIIEDYTGSLAARMQKLKKVLEGKTNLILVGSSYGGLMAARFALDSEPMIRKLILLAPALTIEGFEQAVRQKLQIPTVLYHGTRDDVVPPQAVKAIAEKTFARLEHHFVEDDHPLNNVFPTLPWPLLLEQGPAAETD